MTRQCPNCGGLSLSPDEQFCDLCGTQLPEVPERLQTAVTRHRVGGETEVVLTSREAWVDQGFVPLSMERVSTLSRRSRHAQQRRRAWYRRMGLVALAIFIVAAGSVGVFALAQWDGPGDMSPTPLPTPASAGARPSPLGLATAAATPSVGLAASPHSSDMAQVPEVSSSPASIPATPPESAPIAPTLTPTPSPTATAVLVATPVASPLASATPDPTSTPRVTPIDELVGLNGYPTFTSTVTPTVTPTPTPLQQDGQTPVPPKSLNN